MKSTEIEKMMEGLIKSGRAAMVVYSTPTAKGNSIAFEIEQNVKQQKINLELEINKALGIKK